MSRTSYMLSKSSFLKYEQCHKAFFLHKNFPYLRDKAGTDKQLTFKRGHDVGSLAHQLFPGGKDVSQISGNAQEAAQLTISLMSEGEQTIYEATFIHNNLLIMADILVREGATYNAYEIKSSLKVSEAYLKDAYLQFYVLKNCIPSFDDLFLVTLNPEYERGKDLDLKKLFRKRSVKDQAVLNFGYFEHRIDAATKLIEKNQIPDTAIGKQCFKPYQCDYFGSCWKNHSHPGSVFNFPLVSRDKQFEWIQQGIHDISELSSAQLEKDLHFKIRDAYIKNGVLSDRVAIRNILGQIKGTCAVMDMEIWSPAVPEIEGTKCFEQLPFLVSFYDGTEFSNCFVDFINDDRLSFARGLLSIAAKYESIVVYDKNLELMIINRLAFLFPELWQELEDLKTKLVDLFDIFLRFHYYHPGFRNSFSLKSVSSILLPELRYPRISSGLEAMNVFDAYRTTENPIEKQLFRDELIDYCNTDCLATFGLMSLLKNMA